LIISLWIITTPVHLLIIELAVVALALQAIVVNRLAGVDYPIWAKRISTSQMPLGNCAVDYRAKTNHGTKVS
jgi:hypothetical protein